jgi:hypothetical protein
VTKCQEEEDLAGGEAAGAEAGDLAGVEAGEAAGAEALAEAGDLAGVPIPMQQPSLTWGMVDTVTHTMARGCIPQQERPIDHTHIRVCAPQGKEVILCPTEVEAIDGCIVSPGSRGG